MKDTASRMFAAVGVLVGVWVVTYWAYQPAGHVKITRDDGAPALAGGMVIEAGMPGPAQSAAPEAAREPARDMANNAMPAGTAEGVVPETADPVKPMRLEYRTRVIAPQFREIVVKKGDTSWQKVAKRELGDAKHWEAVARSNPLITSDRLKPGKTRLRIPLDPSNTQGKVVEVQVPVEVGAEENPLPPAEAQAPSAPAAQETPRARTHTIAGGDTLWSIAKKHYGKGGSWMRIYEANKAVIPDPDRPPMGATILIPD